MFLCKILKLSETQYSKYNYTILSCAQLYGGCIVNENFIFFALVVSCANSASPAPLSRDAVIVVGRRRCSRNAPRDLFNNMVTQGGRAQFSLEKRKFAQK